MFCTKCGAELPEGSKFCHACGAPVEEVKKEDPVVEETIKETTEESVTEETTEETTEEPMSEENTETPTAEAESDEKVSSDSNVKRKIFDTSDTFTMIIQIVAIVLALVFVGHFFGKTFPAISDAFSALKMLFRHPIYAIFRLAGSIFKLAAGLLSGGAVLVYAVSVLNWKKEKASKYLLAASAAGLVASVCVLFAEVMHWLAGLIVYQVGNLGDFGNFGKIIGFTIVGNAIWVVAMYLAKVNVIESIDTTQIKNEFWDSFFTVVDEVKETVALLQKDSEEKKKAKEAAYNDPNVAKAVTPGMDNATGAVNMGGNSMRPFIPLKTDRSLLLLIILSAVTCGIYPIIFWYKLVEDVNIACEGDGEETTNFIVAIVLSMITCGIYSFIWYYKLGDRLHTNGMRYGVDVKESGSSILLWLLLGSFLCGFGPIIAMYIIINNTNKICWAYNSYNMQQR